MPQEEALGESSPFLCQGLDSFLQGEVYITRHLKFDFALLIPPIALT